MKNLKKEKLTQKRLKELLDYDPDTGIFTRAVTTGSFGCYKKGSVAGGKTSNGCFIQIEKNVYRMSHLAFLYMVGNFPKNYVRFKDNNKFNLKWDNIYEIITVPKKLTQDFLKYILDYNQHTGVFTWIYPTSTAVNIGDIAGRVNKTTGYRDISIGYHRTHASRLANLYMLGYLPEHEMDHWNRIRDDDRWENINHVTHSCNMKNAGISKRNKTGVIGVSWCSEKLKWKVQLSINRKHVVNKRFDSFIDAVKARWEAEKKYGWPNCNSSSTSFLYLKERGLV